MRPQNQVLTKIRNSYLFSWPLLRITCSWKTNVSGLWDHYKITSQGPPSIESSIPNHVDMKTNSTASQNDAKLMSRNDAKTTSHCVETTNFVTSTNVKLDNEICVKNDNILSRQQPVRKIQPFQVRVTPNQQYVEPI